MKNIAILIVIELNKIQRLGIRFIKLDWKFFPLLRFLMGQRENFQFGGIRKYLNNKFIEI